MVHARYWLMHNTHYGKINSASSCVCSQLCINRQNLHFSEKNSLLNTNLDRTDNMYWPVFGIWNLTNLFALHVPHNMVNLSSVQGDVTEKREWSQQLTIFYDFRRFIHNPKDFDLISSFLPGKVSLWYFHFSFMLAVFTKCRSLFKGFSEATHHCGKIRLVFVHWRIELFKQTNLRFVRQGNVWRCVYKRRNWFCRNEGRK